LDTIDRAISPDIGDMDFEFETGFVHKVKSGESKVAICSSESSFQVSDWEIARPIVKKIIKETSKETGCGYFSWAKKGNQLLMEASFIDSKSLLTHFEKIRPFINTLTAGPAKMSKLEIHGAPSEISKIKGDVYLNALQARYIDDSGGKKTKTSETQIIDESDAIEQSKIKNVE